MKHLYLFTLEVAPVEVGKVYDELPSHLTLMSRFSSYLSAEQMADTVRPLFMQTNPIELAFGNTEILGPKKVTVHLVEHSNELRSLHNKLRHLLDAVGVDYQYPEFIGDNYRPHVTQRQGVQFSIGDRHVTQAAYLIEVINKKRVIRSRFTIGK